MRIPLVLQLADGSTEDVVVDLDAEHYIGDLATALHSATPRWGPNPGILEVDRLGPLDPNQRVGIVGLRPGDRVRRRGSSPGRSESTTQEGGVELAVTSGPMTGFSMVLAAGTHTIGRASNCTVVLNDETASRLHAEITIDGRDVIVRDCGSRNGTFVDGHRITEPMSIAPHNVIELGSTLLVVRPVGPPSAHSHLRFPSVDFNRPPRTRRPLDSPTIDIPSPPEEPRKSPFPVGASVVPILMGVVMAVALSQLTFLLFAAMGPIMAVWSLVDDRRSGRRQYRRAAAGFIEELERRRAELEQHRMVVVSARRAAAPSPTELARRAQGISLDLWERRPSDDDFLCLRLGCADLPTRMAISAPSTGGGQLRARAEELAAQFSIDPNVPVTVDLTETTVVGIIGDHARRHAVGRSLLLQAATLHSPAELAIAVVTPSDADDGWDWSKWLPHLRTLDAMGINPVARTREEATTLLTGLRDLARERSRRSSTAEGSVAPLPHVLILLAGDVGAPPALLSETLRAGRSAGVHAICLADAVASLPGEATVIFEIRSEADGSTLTFTATGARTDRVIPDLVGVEVARAAALALAPMSDVTARSATGSLPDHVSLLELLDLVEPDEGRALTRWSSADRKSLQARVGVDETGPLVIDLRRDGPHALVGGTSGAGKSELLQTMVASLAASYSTGSVNFVLIDYKGGAAFKDCKDLPHTVGFVTDLDEHLAHRALTSLNAELRRREELLRRSDAGDLLQLLRRDPDNAPPSLVIVVDEFATLAKEVPDFVTGIVDVAQRGRSLGVHLVLATQRPQGAINDNIRANTNLRISLRVTDEAESRDVIDVPDAAYIPRSLPGRALIRTGHGEVRHFQAAYVGGHTRREPKVGRIQVRPFVLGEPFTGPAAIGGHTESRANDLQRLVAALAAAQRAAGLPTPRNPWLPPLPALVTTSDLGDTVTGAEPGGSDPELAIPLGLLDDPPRQRQAPWTLDLHDIGHALVYGTSGSGKTTLLRTLAAGAAQRYPADALHIYALDFASGGLGALGALPHCGGVVNGADTERVERLFTMLETALEARKALLGRAGIDSIAELPRVQAGAEIPPRVLVLLDGYPAFHEAFDTVDNGALVDALARLVTEGRPLGIHLVITSDRRSAVPMTLTGSIRCRIVLRMADPDDYAALDLAAAARGVELFPGRALVDGGMEVQIATVDREASSAAQARAINRLGERMSPASPGREPQPVRVLPLVVPRAELPPPPAGQWAVPIGIDGTTRDPLWIDLAESPHFVVAGPDRSGRSTTLVTLASALVASQPEAGFVVLAPRRTPLVDMTLPTRVVEGLTACETAVTELAAELSSRSHGSPPLVVVIDDGDELTDVRASDALESVVRRGRDVGVHVIAAAQTHVLHRTFGGWLSEIRKAKHGVVLMPDVDIDGELFAVRLPRKALRAFPPGRGYLVRRADLRLIQVAS